MEELLASQTSKFTTLFRGQQIEGEVVALTDKEIILDLGTKSEGLLPKKDAPEAKIGDKIKVFVVLTENEHGQVILSTSVQAKLSPKGRFKVDWSKFNQAQANKSKVNGTILESNKGGMVVEVDGIRGFLPNSQKSTELESGQAVPLYVIEVDQANNKLIFSQKEEISEEDFKKILEKYPADEVVKGEVITVGESGVTFKLEGIEGFLPSSKMGSQKFEVGKSFTVLVDGVDSRKRIVNLAPMITSTEGLIYK